MREGVDFYIDENGNYVFTEAYLLGRGYCCGCGCRHCPYESKSNLLSPIAGKSHPDAGEPFFTNQNE
ncbi:MAG: DUF5522 domain-containing protein [Chitinophagales bacterium]|nr:DUF5522 domain-containing protein [Chitinophagales bacterium]MDW8393002.1 DUF5522 domain-containing protein [Chitinophagales bacterium]